MGAAERVKRLPKLKGGEVFEVTVLANRRGTRSCGHRKKIAVPAVPLRIFGTGGTPSSTRPGFHGAFSCQASNGLCARASWAAVASCKVA